MLCTSNSSNVIDQCYCSLKTNFEKKREESKRERKERQEGGKEGGRKTGRKRGKRGRRGKDSFPTGRPSPERCLGTPPHPRPSSVKSPCPALSPCCFSAKHLSRKNA